MGESRGWMMLWAAVVEGEVRRHSDVLHISLIVGRMVKKKEESVVIHACFVRFMLQGDGNDG